jgi:murein L,D-transpeptidase YcbB/YkuD
MGYGQFMKTARVSILCMGILLCLTSCSSAQLGRETLQTRISKVSTPSSATVQSEKLYKADAIAAFYKARNAEPAWKLPDDAESMRHAIDDMARDGLNPADYHRDKIDALLEQRKKQRTDELDADLELLLSDAAATMIDHARYGRVRPVTLNPKWNVDPRKDAPPLNEALARVREASSPAEGIEKEKLDHFIYKGLRDELDRLQKVAGEGGWEPVAEGKVIQPGASDPRIPAVRKRLAATGELKGDGANADSVYDEPLQEAVKLFQARHRLDPDGQIDKLTIDAMNISAPARADQVRANLERARWVLPGLKGDFVLVNLPAFKAYLIRDNQNVWESRTQIGKEARQTPSFRANMKYAIFNPTWTVPATILREDMIAKKHLKVYDRDGNEVNPASVNWSADAKSFPYTLRQPAGEKNALGRVKFMFPNPYDIYLHDTPSKELFQAEKRTFSSGCIRLEKPIELAEVLLGDQGYDRAKIDQVVASGKTTTVNLAQPLPVLIVYWTTSVGASGEVRYAPDVYALDPPLVQALGAAPGRISRM